jgi:hypothetical protein
MLRTSRWAWAVDQGGCFDDTRPTTHADPTFEVHDSIFYCVANMPGAVPNTSTYALTNATLPYVVALADKGWEQACRDDQSLALGLNTYAGQLTNAPVGAATGIPSVPSTPPLSTLGEVLGAIEVQCPSAPAGRLVRGFGFHEFKVSELRNPPV